MAGEGGLRGEVVRLAVQVLEVRVDEADEAAAADVLEARAVQSDVGLLLADEAGDRGAVRVVAGDDRNEVRRALDFDHRSERGLRVGSACDDASVAVTAIVEEVRVGRDVLGGQSV